MWKQETGHRVPCRRRDLGSEQASSTDTLQPRGILGVGTLCPWATAELSHQQLPPCATHMWDIHSSVNKHIRPVLPTQPHRELASCVLTDVCHTCRRWAHSLRDTRKRDCVADECVIDVHRLLTACI